MSSLPGLLPQTRPQVLPDPVPHVDVGDYTRTPTNPDFLVGTVLAKSLADQQAVLKPGNCRASNPRAAIELAFNPETQLTIGDSGFGNRLCPPSDGTHDDPASAFEPASATSMATAPASPSCTQEPSKEDGATRSRGAMQADHITISVPKALGRLVRLDERIILATGQDSFG